MIFPISALPPITGNGMKVDGTTQPGYSGTPIVILDGVAIPSVQNAVGFRAGANNIEIRGLAIRNFDGNGIYAGSATGLIVEGNEITGNESGVAYGSTNTTITDNVISENEQTGTSAVGGVGGMTTISGNLVTDNGQGGITAHGDIVQVSDNIVTGNGLQGMSAAGNSGAVNDNVISGNGFEASPSPHAALNIGGIGGLTITGNEVTDNADIGITLGSDGHTIGGLAPEDANVISGNGGEGIWVPYEGMNSILRNSIFGNGSIGIDLGFVVDANDSDVPSGVTPNDPMDADAGANALQNYPVLEGAVSGSVAVTGSLNSNPGTQFRIEFFHNDSCDPSGFGEGETFLGATTVTADAGGDALIEAVLPAAPAGFITSTATNQDGGGTSEFSNCVPIVSPATPTPTPSPSPTATATATPATATPTATQQRAVQGDVDCNGTVNPLDALGIFKESAQIDDSGDCIDDNGDTDCDDAITPNDGVGILRFEADLPPNAPGSCPGVGEEL